MIADKDRLSRIPLEAGHTNSYKSQKRENAAKSRRIARDKIKHEDYDNIVPVRAHYNSYETERHDDKLGGVMRWLRSQVGRPWDKIYSEIRERFSMDTITGWHILSHLKVDDIRDPRERHWIEQGSGSARFPVLYVDWDGILKKAKIRKTKERVKALTLEKWLNGWLIHQEGALYFWAMTENEDTVCTKDTCIYHEKYKSGHVHTKIIRYAKLTAEQVATYLRLKEAELGNYH